ncbi:hypothetical protein RRG08_054524, partial [Elysia crispata]
MASVLEMSPLVTHPRAFIATILLILHALPQGHAQQGDECPELWYEHKNFCYKFEQHPTTIQRAQIECQQDWATLLKVHDSAEHAFIQRILEQKTTSVPVWFTSGYRAGDGTLKWARDGSDIQTNFFLPQVRNRRDQLPGLNIENDRIVYEYDKANRSFVWTWNRIMSPGGFICQIAKADTWKIFQQRRDFSYGSSSRDENQWNMGPNITYHSPNTLFFEIEKDRVTPFVLDCQAVGNPRPTYKWFRQADMESPREEVSSALGPNYAVTNGRLTISEPKKEKDAGLYTCEASNNIGTVQSNPIEVGHRYLAQFGTYDVAATEIILFKGAEISCQSIDSTADLAFNWFKQTIGVTVRPDLNPQYFISKSGKLYISEVQQSDQAEYYCVASMVAKQDEVMASDQSPSRISKPIKVIVKGGSALSFGPEIQDKFPQSFPAVPKIGDRVEIECLAYGSLPIFYSWRREDGPMSPQAQFMDHKRRLVFPRARLEDSGVYTCLADGPSKTSNKTTYLSLKARPSFPYPLRNQHLDLGSDFSWRCLAVGVPLPTYTWFKNGVKLQTDSQKNIEVRGNFLTIKGVDVQHEGMYQCEAKNTIGLARSSAQLRAL